MFSFRTGFWESGQKRRAVLENYGTWVAGLFDMSNAARTKVEPGYVSVAGKEGGKILSRATPHVPFE
jgi:hypothetical protein